MRSCNCVWKWLAKPASSSCCQPCKTITHEGDSREMCWLLVKGGGECESVAKENVENSKVTGKSETHLSSPPKRPASASSASSVWRRWRGILRVGKRSANELLPLFFSRPNASSRCERDAANTSSLILNANLRFLAGYGYVASRNIHYNHSISV